MKSEVSRMNALSAIHFFSLNQPPEEEALTAALQYAKNNGLTDQTSRLFGRNIYLTDQPEPHGYEYYLTGENIKLGGNATASEIQGGLYAVLEATNLFKLAEFWQELMGWVEANGYEPIGVKKGPYGWVNSAYEELLDWQQQNPPTEWRFRLWVQLKE